jgi:hypothetical protein
MSTTLTLDAPAPTANRTFWVAWRRRSGIQFIGFRHEARLATRPQRPDS